MSGWPILTRGELQCIKPLFEGQSQPITMSGYTSDRYKYNAREQFMRFLTFQLSLISCGQSGLINEWWEIV